MLSFFMNFASLLGWLGKVVHSVRVFDSAWMLVLNSSCHGHLSSHRIKLRICTACYPVLVLFPHWTVISICCSKTTPKYKREKNAHPTFVRLINWRWTQNSSNRSNNDAAIWRWLRPASHRPPIRVKMLTGKERVCIGFLFHIFIFFSSTNNLISSLYIWYGLFWLIM